MKLFVTLVLILVCGFSSKGQTDRLLDSVSDYVADVYLLDSNGPISQGKGTYWTTFKFEPRKVYKNNLVSIPYSFVFIHGDDSVYRAVTYDYDKLNEGIFEHTCCDTLQSGDYLRVYLKCGMSSPTEFNHPNDCEDEFFSGLMLVAAHPITKEEWLEGSQSRILNEEQNGVLSMPVSTSDFYAVVMDPWYNYKTDERGWLALYDQNFHPEVHSSGSWKKPICLSIGALIQAKMKKDDTVFLPLLQDRAEKEIMFLLDRPKENTRDAWKNLKVDSSSLMPYDSSFTAWYAKTVKSLNLEKPINEVVYPKDSTSNMCELLSNGDWKGIEKYIQKKVVKINKSSNEPGKIQEVQDWLNSEPCISMVVPPGAILMIYPARINLGLAFTYNNVTTWKNFMIISGIKDGTTKRQFNYMLPGKLTDMDGYNIINGYQNTYKDNVLGAYSRCDKIATIFTPSGDYFFYSYLETGNQTNVIHCDEGKWRGYTTTEQIKKYEEKKWLYSLLIGQINPNIDLRLKALQAVRNMKDKRALPFLIELAEFTAHQPQAIRLEPFAKEYAYVLLVTLFELANIDVYDKERCKNFPFHMLKVTALMFNDFWLETAEK